MEHILNEKTLAFARLLVETAKANGCCTFTATFRPEESIRGASVTVNWSRGRHHAAANVSVESTAYETFEV
jgi:hypothetical protein